MTTTIKTSAAFAAGLFATGLAMHAGAQATSTPPEVVPEFGVDGIGLLMLFGMWLLVFGSGYVFGYYITKRST